MAEKKPRGRHSAQDSERRMRVGRIIRRYRTAAGMDQATLASYFGYTKTAIGNWELGLTRPDIDNIPILCRTLNIPVTELLGMEAEAVLPTSDRELLDCYRDLNRFNQNTVRQLMDRLRFQQDRQEKARLREIYAPMCLYEDTVSAGIGTPMLDDAGSETRYVLREDIPRGADCILRVNGRSMEPTFASGSCVYVATAAEMSYGQIGIFIVNGDAFIKEYRQDGLHSHNPRFKTIYTGEGTDVRCFGRVLGAVDAAATATGELAERVEAAFDEV